MSFRVDIFKHDGIVLQSVFPWPAHSLTVDRRFLNIQIAWMTDRQVRRSRSDIKAYLFVSCDQPSVLAIHNTSISQDSRVPESGRKERWDRHNSRAIIRTIGNRTTHLTPSSVIFQRPHNRNFTISSWPNRAATCNDVLPYSSYPLMSTGSSILWVFISLHWQCQSLLECASPKGSLQTDSKPFSANRWSKVRCVVW